MSQEIKFGTPRWYTWKIKKNNLINGFFALHCNALYSSWLASQSVSAFLCAIVIQLSIMISTTMRTKSTIISLLNASNRTKIDTTNEINFFGYIYLLLQFGSFSIIVYSVSFKCVCLCLCAYINIPGSRVPLTIENGRNAFLNLLI